MGSPWTPALKRHRRKVINETFALLAEQGFHSTDADEYVCESIGSTPATAARWRLGHSIPVGEMAEKLESLLHSLKHQEVTTPEKKAKTKVEAKTKETAHTGTVLAVNALVPHLTFGELLDLSEAVAREISVRHKERNGG